LNAEISEEGLMNHKIIVKIITIICLIFISISIWLIKSSPTTGYESSIYKSTPIFVWVILILCIICGIAIVILSLTKEYVKGTWIYGFILILICDFIILSLYILKGYYLWDAMGDLGFHISAIKNIMLTSHINGDNFYPITHIYVAELCKILNLNYDLFVKWLPVYFALLSMIGIYLLCKILLPEKGQVIIASLLGTALIEGWFLSFTPNHLANNFFPIALYLLIMGNISGSSNILFKWKSLFIIIIFLYSAFHPVPALALLIILISLGINIKSWPPLKFNEQYKVKINIYIILLFVVLIVTWISSFYIWNATIQNLQHLISEGGTNHIVDLLSNITAAESQNYSVMDYFIKVYGAQAIILLLALIAVPFLYKKSLLNHKLYAAFNLYKAFLVLIIVLSILYVTNIGFGPLRLLIYLVELSIIPAGFILYEIWKWAQNSQPLFKKVTPYLIMVIIIAISFMGILSCYPSPYTYEPNPQTTLSDIDGTTWFILNKNDKLGYTSWYYSALTLGRVVFTDEELYKHGITPYDIKAFPDHFGYQTSPYLGHNYSEDTYLILTDMLKKMYTDVYPQSAKYRLMPDDFIKLETDKSVEPIYSNGGFQVWSVHSITVNS
jgi:hypothetical protein